MIDSVLKSDLFQSSQGRLINNDQPKRFRSGSLSGRLRTASDLEEIGYIDKYQKGVIKGVNIP